MRHGLLVGVVCVVFGACQGSPVAPSDAAAVFASRDVGTHASGSRHTVEGTIVKACLLITIDDTDSRNNVIGTIRGSGSVYDVIEGINPEPGVNPPIYNAWRLKSSLLPVGTPDIRVEGGVMLNSDVPAVVRNEYSQDTTLWWTVELGVGINPTRAEMQTRLRNEAYVNRNCTHYWQIVPGDSLAVAAAGQPGDLLSKFLPLP